MTVKAQTTAPVVGNIRNIVVMGDSQVSDPIKWPEHFRNIMAQKYPQYDFRLYKSGVGAETIPWGYNRLSSMYKYNPTIFVINYGTNDANGAAVGSYRTDPARFGWYLSLMIDKIRKDTGAMVVVMSTAPTYDRERSHPMANLTNINNEARKVCQQKGAIYVDVFNSMINTGNFRPYISDGLHYSEAGSVFASQVLFNTVSPHFR